MDKQKQRHYDELISNAEFIGNAINSLEYELSELKDKYEELEKKYNDLLQEMTDGTK